VAHTNKARQLTFQRHHLGMTGPCTLVPPFTNDAAVAHHDASHPRIRRRRAEAPLGQGSGLVRSWSKAVPGPNEAVLWPIRLRHSPSLGRIKKPHTIFTSGFALDEGSKQRMECDASFPLSSHADFPGLLEYVRACEPDQVVLLQGSGTELKDDLTALGLGVSTLGPPQQMDLF